ncbi:MAG: hypothetical protein RL030_1212 [Pseudomonadota bacterium]
MPLVRLITPASEVERMTTVAMLEAHGIACHGHGDAFNTLYPGAQLGSRNAQAILVEEAQLHLARLILAAPPQWEESPDED